MLTSTALTTTAPTRLTDVPVIVLRVYTNDTAYTSSIRYCRVELTPELLATAIRRIDRLAAEQRGDDPGIVQKIYHDGHADWYTSLDDIPGFPFDQEEELEMGGWIELAHPVADRPAAPPCAATETEAEILPFGDTDDVIVFEQMIVDPDAVSWMGGLDNVACDVQSATIDRDRLAAYAEALAAASATGAQQSVYTPGTAQ